MFRGVITGLTDSSSSRFGAGRVPALPLAAQGGVRVVDEWLRINRLPQIEFRSIAKGGVVCIKGGTAVWQVVMVTDRQQDVVQTAEHLALTQEQVEAALRYHEDYLAEIDLALSENREGFDRLKRLLPHICRTNMTDDDLAGIVVETAQKPFKYRCVRCSSNSMPFSHVIAD